MMDNRRLSEAVRRDRTLLDAASDVVSCVDENGTVTHLSDAVRSQLGYIPSEWIGKPAFGLVHPDDLALTVENFIATVDRTASSAPGTLRVLHASGERSEEHTSELQSLMRISYAVFCLTTKNKNTTSHAYNSSINHTNNSTTPVNT